MKEPLPIKPSKEIIAELDQCCGKERNLTDAWENKEKNQICFAYSCDTCGNITFSLENKPQPITLSEEQYQQITKINWEIQNKTYEIENLLEKIRTPHLKELETCYNSETDED